ncbi:MAG TPA: hypothetical protein DCQ29_13655 [Chitinophagaceae bacterium]|nr:hypothetical protein [Chitinophagaceae bacterium]
MKYLLLATLAAVLGFQMSWAQQKIEENLLNYYDNYQPEKVHLHLDKTTYNPGDNIWFKAYLVTGNTPSTQSKTLYVVMSDDDGNVLQFHTSPIFDGTTSGNLTVPSSFKQNTVHLKAYTKWSLNFDSSFLWERNISIVQPVKKAATPATKLQVAVDFLPEGGYLIENIPAKLAFRAINQQGHPATIIGVLKDDKGKIIDSIRTIHDGMGYLLFTPQSGVKYTATYKDEKNQSYTYSVPSALPQGISIRVNNTYDKKNFIVARSENLPDAQKIVHLVATFNYQMIYRARIDLTKNTTTSGSIPTADLPTGIIVLTLFDNNWKPIAERITYVNNDNYGVDAQLNVAVQSLKRRGKNILEIKTYDTTITSFSMAVTDADIPYDGSRNIVSELLLSQELKGKVNNPVYYLSNTEISKEHLDLVMLTHGWRRYNWEAILNNQAPTFADKKDDSFLGFSGVVRGGTPTDYRLAANITLIMMSRDSSKQLFLLPLDGQGRFEDKKFLFFDTVQLFYQFNKNEALTRKASVAFNNGLLQAPEKAIALYPLYGILDTIGQARARFLAQEKERLEKLLQGTTLEGVIVSTKKKDPKIELDKQYASGMFSGGDAYTFDLSNDTRVSGMQNVLQYLQGMVPGLQINNAFSPTDASASWRGSATQFFLDQMPVDAQTLNTMSINDIAYVKVFRPPFYGSVGGGAGGAIAVYTKKGGATRSDAPSKLMKQALLGYTARKQFYSPDYGNEKETYQGADVRTTLYWNPYLLTDSKNKKATVTFFNNDVSRRLRVVIEGMNENGQLINIEKIIE